MKFRLFMFLLVASSLFLGCAQGQPQVRSQVEIDREKKEIEARMANEREVWLLKRSRGEALDARDRYRICNESWEKLKPGMSLEQVQAVIGKFSIFTSSAIVAIFGDGAHILHETPTGEVTFEDGGLIAWTFDCQPIINH